MWFDWNNVVLTLAQTACIALPAAGVPPFLERFTGRAWALILPLSIGVVIGAIALVPSTADVLTWTALILVPTGAAIAFGWAMHGARWWLAPLAAPLLAIAWTSQDTRVGQLAAIVLITGSAVAAGRLLAGAAPLSLLKIGVVVMAAIDAYLVFSNKLQHPNAVLVAAAVVGGILAVDRVPQLPFMVLMFVLSLAWDQLFLVYDVLPATIPPALVLIAAEGWRRWRARPVPALSGVARQHSTG
jgi:hypothetical protein